MGFKVPKQGYKLTFPEFDGLWLRMTAPSIGEVMKLSNLITLKNLKVEDLTESDVEALTYPQRIFAKHLMEWSLTDDDDDGNEIPVPATYDGVSNLPADFFKRLVHEWIANTTEVTDQSPLASRSLGGLRFPEESIPMDLSFQNLRS